MADQVPVLVVQGHLGGRLGDHDRLAGPQRPGRARRQAVFQRVVLDVPRLPPGDALLVELLPGGGHRRDLPVDRLDGLDRRGDDPDAADARMFLVRFDQGLHLIGGGLVAPTQSSLVGVLGQGGARASQGDDGDRPGRPDLTIGHDRPHFLLLSWLRVAKRPPSP